MSLHAQLSEEAKAELAAQKRVSSISSIVVSILSCFLLGLILFVIAMTVEVKEPPHIKTYPVADQEAEIPERPEVSNDVVKPPSAPMKSMRRVIAPVNTSSLSISNPNETVATASLDFNNGDSFSEGFEIKDWMSDPNGGTLASFLGQTVKAERVAYVIDYSMSMKGKRDTLMRKELTKSIKELPSTMDYQMIYFAGPAWVAGDEVSMAKDRRKATITTADGVVYEWSGKGVGDWKSSGQKVSWMKATSQNIRESLSHVKSTPLVYGTAWEIPLQMALDMKPTPDVIYFMTDGASGRDSEKIAKSIGNKAKTKGVKINTIAMMVPSAKEALGEMAKRSGGQFSIVGEDGKAQIVIKGE